MRTLRLTRLSVDAAPTGFLLAAVALDSGSIFVTFARNQLVFSRAGEELASLPFDEPPERVHAQWLGSRQMLSLAFGDDRLFALSLNDDGPPAISLVGQLESAITAACWSPDEEALALTTQTDLLLLDASYELVREQPLRPREHGSDAIVALGWGDVSTQFDGPGIKRQTRPTDDENEAIVLAAADDRDLISWRGDSEHFCVGTRDVDKLGVGKRMIRLYGRDGELKATNEPMTGLAATLAWQPSGSLIAAARQTLKDGSTANAVVLLERIGLQRSSFELEGCCGRIQAMAWDPTSTLLAVWLADTALSQESVRIYSRKNYHWYHMHETDALTGIRGISWDAEETACLCIAHETGLERRRFTWHTIRSRTGVVAVIDGGRLLITDLANEAVPPPEASLVVIGHARSCSYIDATLSDNADYIAGLRANGAVDLWRLELTPNASSARLVAAQRLLAGSLCRPKQIVCTHVGVSAVRIAAIGIAQGGDVLRSLAFDTSTGICHVAEVFNVPPSLLYSSSMGNLACQEEMGDLVLRDTGGRTREGGKAGPAMIYASIGVCKDEDGEAVLVRLTEDGRLFMRSSEPIVTNCTSFVACDCFVAFTTSASRLAIRFGDSTRDPQLKDRAIERGARVIAATSTSVFLQMPRGNLETIQPRALLLRQVNSLVAAGHFSEAFFLCRTHRVDMNVLTDPDATPLLLAIETFVDELDEPDYVSLFLQTLKEPATAPVMPISKVNTIAQAVLQALLERDRRRYIPSILTAHLCMRPSRIEAALEAVAQLEAYDDGALIDDALQYLCMLVADTDKLFDAALGMYNLRLALLVAQHSSKDPREYVPFLQRLDGLAILYRRHAIDDHLSRFANALRNLVAAGIETEPELDACISYARKHQLLDDLVALLAGRPDRQRRAIGARAEWLMGNGEHQQAAACFSYLGLVSEELKALQAALDWRAYFTLALSPANLNKPGQRQIASLAAAFADALATQCRFVEAGRVRLDYAQDVMGCVAELGRGTEWQEACRIATLYGRAELIDADIKVSALRASSSIRDAVAEATAQACKQGARLLELQEKRALADEQREDEVDDAMEVASDDSTAAGSLFTRYTARTTASRGSAASGNTARSHRRQVIKELAGKKDTIYEDIYIYSSLSKLVTLRLEEFRGDVKTLVDGLLAISRYCQQGEDALDAARSIQITLIELESTLAQVVESAWSVEVDDAGRAVRPAEPVLAPSHWQSSLLAVLQ